MMDNEFKHMDLQNIAGGAAQELFGHCLQEVLDNIADENRDPEKPRTITLKFTFIPERDRTMAGVDVDSAVSLAPVMKHKAIAYLKRERGRTVAYAHNMIQQELPFDNNVKPIGGTDVK